MPDANITKSKISRKDLPASSPNGTYKIRYQILSKDALGATAWSPYYTLTPSKTISLITGTINPVYTPATPDLTVSWQIPAAKTPFVTYYDVYFQWYIGAVWKDWKFYKTISSTNGVDYSLTVTKDTSATRGHAAVFAATEPKLTSAEIVASTTSGKNGFMNRLFLSSSSVYGAV
jgi:hypothetical protein